MKKNNIFLYIYILLFSTTMSSCVEELKTENYYTFTGQTITDFVESNDNFSSFLYVLERTNMNSLLSAYGEYTCFIPTNAAIDKYLSERGKTNVKELTDEECDTIAYGHIIKDMAYMTIDMNEGVLGTPNMNERYIQITIDSLTGDFYVNKTTKIIIRDQELENGVGHVIDNVMKHSILMLPDLMEELSDSLNISLFCEAMRLTGFQGYLQQYIDESFTPRDDEFGDGVDRNGFRKYYPTSRLIGYTGFIETNKAYANAGIDTSSIQGLIDYAKQIYDEVYPNDADITDFKNRRNSLNRFVAYHFLDRKLYTDKMTTYLHYNEGSRDAFDFYETMCPGTIMKASRGRKTGGQTMLNRRFEMSHGLFRSVKGVPVSEANMYDASNGVFYLIDAPLVYSKTVVNEVLNDRMRFDAATLLPELATNGIFRNGDGKGTVAQGLNKAYQITSGKYSYVKNLRVYQDAIVYYQAPSIAFWCWYADEIIAEGTYDFDIKLPPVPSGTYEIRYGYVPMGHRGVTQVYVDNIPCGIPIDLTEDGTSPKIGWVSDKELGSEEEITKNDKAMHNRGYMKGPITQAEGRNETEEAQNTDGARDQSNHLRRIVATMYLDNEKDHYIRFRAVDETGEEFMFDYLELCPKSVYDNPKLEEDRN